MARIPLIIAILVMAVSSLSYAWESCPFGQVNDRYPGKCGLYEDTNNDSLCDHSQKNPSLLASARDTAVPGNAGAIKPQYIPKPVLSVQTRRKNSAPAANTASFIADTAGSETFSSPVPRPASPLRQRYPLWQVFMTVLALAAATEMMIKRNKRLTLPLQAAWNWALALSFLLTIGSSLVFVYPALLMRMKFNIGYWHALTGLVMIAAGLYHMIRRFGWMWRGDAPSFRCGKDSCPRKK